MPTYRVQNIIVGAAALYVSNIDSTSATWVQTGATPIIGALGPALPSLTANATGTTAIDADTTNWRSAGFTSEGVEVSYEPQFGDIEVDQLLDIYADAQEDLTFGGLAVPFDARAAFLAGLAAGGFTFLGEPRRLDAVAVKTRIPEL